MSLARSRSFGVPENLAPVAPGMVRSLAMAHPSVDPAAKLQRAKMRLYVLAQGAGWGAFLFLQLFLLNVVSQAERTSDLDRSISAPIFITTSGLLLTHFARLLIARWGWKELNWRALLPRVVLFSFAMAVCWIGFGWGYFHGVLGFPLPNRANPIALFFFGSLNASFVTIGWLCAYFIYHVFDRLQRMQVEQLRLAASVKDAELRALKSQVNPHFLFNSLNSLRALIDEDAPRARESVTRLANMLRYSLQSGQAETVPFEEELRIVEDYLALEQIRHENRLRVSWSIDAAVRRLPVPPMLLQTLVENAVKYGISSRRGGGEIVISAALTGDELHIRVTNPGDLTSPASTAAARAGSSTGVGLQNASERLTLLFGDRARLSLAAEAGDRVTAHVVIPCENSSS